VAWVDEIKAFRDAGLSPEAYAAKRGIHIIRKSAGEFGIVEEGTDREPADPPVLAAARFSLSN
jgi:hypothetical protein